MIKPSHSRPALRGLQLFILMALPLWSAHVWSAPKVHFFEEPLDDQTTEKKGITTEPGSYKLLMIPVITSSSPFDPDNNLLDSYDPAEPGLHQTLVNKMAIVADFWHEASFGQITLQPTVLNRYYQLPLNAEDIYYPAYVEAAIIGRPVVNNAANIPSGDLTLRLHLANAPEELVTLTLNGANSPYTHTALGDALQGQVDSDKLEIQVSDDNRVRIKVVRRHVDAGVFVNIETGQSDAAVVQALGLDAQGGSDGVVIGQSVGASFPINVQTNETIGLRIEFASGGHQDFLWSIPAGSSFPNAAAFAGAHGSDRADATIVAAGSELRFDLQFNSAEEVANVIFDAKIAGNVSVTTKWGFDDALWGLNDVKVSEGVVTHAKRNLLKYSSRLVVGQAMAAYLLNELTRPPSGPDSIPNTEISQANEAALTDIFEDTLLEYDVIQAIFLDITGKRAQASHGSIDMGIDNGNYQFTFQTYSDLQVNFITVGENTLAHETGHSINFPDLYDNGSGNYDGNLVYPQDYDIMDNANLHHPGAWNKEFRASWLTEDGAGIDIFAEPLTPGAETRRYVITPLEKPVSYDAALAGVPPDRDVVKLVRLPLGAGSSGEDHFILIQTRQPTANFSQGLPIVPGQSDPGGVYITDCISSKEFNYFKITSRNYVHALTDKSLLPGSNATPLIPLVSYNAINFEAAYPAYAGISINVVGELMGSGGARSYMVDITREQDDYLDLRIAPWGAPPWESPDIWIEHGDKAELSDVPLAGNGEPARWSSDYDPAANDGKPLNWIRVRVENNGTIEARDVQVRLQLNQPGGLGDTGTWEEFPLSDPQDIGPGGEAIFNFAWNPAVGEHTCLKAEVFRWEADFGDLTPSNNGTQENINDFQPTSNSPWKETPFSVEVFNPFEFSLDIRVVPEAVPYGMTVSIDQQEFTLPPHTSVVRKATLKIDDTIYLTPLPNGSGGLTFLYRDPKVGTYVTKQRIAEQFHVAGYAQPDGDFDVPIGGVTYNVYPTTTTAINFSATAGGCDIFAVGGSTTPAAGNEKLEVEVRYPSGRMEWIEFTTAANGTFFKDFAPKEGGDLRVTIVYPPGGLFAATRSDEKTVFNPWVTVSAVAVPPNGGSVSGTGCFNVGAKTTLAAAANAGFVFKGWSNRFTGVFASSAAMLPLLVNSNLSFVATFVPDSRNAKPDLIVRKLSVPPEAGSGENLTDVSFWISNIGSASATNPAAAVYLSTDNVLDSRDTPLLPPRFSLPLLEAGDTYSLPRSVSLTLPSVPSGEYFLIGILDEKDAIDELSERNNMAAVRIKITRGTTYQEWLAANRYTAGSPEGDDDKDGLSNFGEYYFDQDPTDSRDRSNLPQVVQRNGDLELQFGRLQSTDNVVGVLEIATVLGARTNWRAAREGRDFKVLSITSRGMQEQVRYQILPTRHASTFYRIAVRNP